MLILAKYEIDQRKGWNRTIKIYDPLAIQNSHEDLFRALAYTLLVSGNNDMGCVFLPHCSQRCTNPVRKPIQEFLHIAQK